MSFRESLIGATRRLEKWITPGLQYSQYVYEAVLDETVREGTTWLDLGCGHQVLPEWRWRQELELVSRCRKVVGFDYDLASLLAHRNISGRVKGDASDLPFTSGSFDLVTANMVVEHLANPVRQFSEVARVLRPGGTFLFHTMNTRGYYVAIARCLPQRAKDVLASLLQSRAKEDVFPTYYRANSTSRIRNIVGSTNLVVEEIRMIVSTPQFRVVPPIALLELLWIRLLELSGMRGLRPNIIARLRHAANVGEGVHQESLSHRHITQVGTER